MQPLTPTAIKLATRCPLAYHLAYTDKVPKARPSANQWQGIAVHRALKALGQQRIDGRQCDISAAVGADRNGIRALLTAAIERGILASIPAALEYQLAGEMSGVRVEARADRIDIDAVVEYKTGGEIEAHDVVQAQILARLSGKPCRIVVLSPYRVEVINDSPAVDAAVEHAHQVRTTSDRTANPGDHCAKCPVRHACHA